MIVYEFLHLSVSAQGGQKTWLDHLDLELTGSCDLPDVVVGK